MLEEDTICSVSTPLGEGGIGIVRISGMGALAIAAKVVRLKRGGRIEEQYSHTVQYGHVVDEESGEIIDEALVTVMRAPATYTREDIVEINCHGGAMPLWRTVRLLLGAGARQAEPGEFTKRAFLNGRIDLAQAEAVMDVIRARTEEGHRAANEQLLGGLSREVLALRERLIGVSAGVEAGVDFPDEEIDTPSGAPLGEELCALARDVRRLLEGAVCGRILREGAATAIVGRPNVGKSSLLNELVMQDRAIVTEIPGTTRDVLEGFLNIGGLALRVLDTAGIRHTRDVVEQEGVKRSLAAIESADIVLIVLDGSQPLEAEDRRVLDASRRKTSIAVINKIDLPRKLERLEWPEVQVEISCRTGSGIEGLRASVLSLLRQGMMQPREHAWAVNQRHRLALERTEDSLGKALGSVQENLSPEFIAVDIRDALDHLGMITGETCTEDILERIFRDFCIGK